MATLSLPPPAKAQKYIEYSMENELRGFNSSVKVPTLKLVTVDRVDGKGVVVYRFKSEKHLDNNYGTVHGAAYCAFVDIFASSCVSIKWTKVVCERERIRQLLTSYSFHLLHLSLKLFLSLPISDAASFYSGKRKSVVRAWLLPESSDSLSPFYSHRRMGGSRKHSRFGWEEFGCSPKQYLPHRRSQWWKNWEGCFFESYKNQHCHFHDEAKVKDLTVITTKDGFVCLDEDDSIDAIDFHLFANWYAWLLSTSKCRRQCTSLVWSDKSCRKAAAPKQSDVGTTETKRKQFERRTTKTREETTKRMTWQTQKGLECSRLEEEMRA